MKKAIYLVQIGVSYLSPCFLPYSVGCISAYLKADGEIIEKYDIKDIIVMRETIDKVITRFQNPYMVAFSCYAWNFEYNKTLAKKLKEKFPEVIIVFGGHNVSPDGSILKEYDFVDYCAHNEGEESTAVFLKALNKGSNLSQVPNLSYRENEKVITTEKYIPKDISSYPSPYLTGEFDNIMKEFPEVEFHATLETNRGCPYDCTYCEWCFSKNVRLFPMDKIKKEIRWIAEHKIKYTYCADANFGMFDRDVEIANYVIEQKKKYGYPDVFKPCYAKESNDNVFNAGAVLNKNETDKGVTLAYQTLSEEALRNIGRKNLTFKHFEQINTLCNENGIPTYTELILGLPGETYESFSKGLCDLLEFGQHNSVTVYECQVYPNSVMGSREYREKFGIKTSLTPMLGIHYNPEFNGVNEFFNIITETKSMPKAHWVKACMFSVVLQTFHHFGLLKYFAIYLHNEKNVSYYEFYSELFDYIYGECQGFLRELFDELKARKADTKSADWTYQKDEFGSVGWYFEEGAFLEIVSHFDEYKKEIIPFLKKWSIENELFEDLFNYQMALIRKLDQSDIKVESNWNFYRYFEDSENETRLKKVKSILTVHSEKAVHNWKTYAREVIWFGKRYSATLFINPRDKITYWEE